MLTEKYTTVTRLIDAVRVTEENMADVARWCNGTIEHTDSRTAEQLGRPAQTWIKVNTQNPINEKQTQARVGDWVLYQNKGYKIYTNASFNRNFEKVHKAEPKIEVETVDIPKSAGEAIKKMVQVPVTATLEEVAQAIQEQECDQA